MITAFVFASAPATLLGPDRIKALEKWSWLGQPQVKKALVGEHGKGVVIHIQTHPFAENILTPHYAQKADKQGCYPTILSFFCMFLNFPPVLTRNQVAQMALNALRTEMVTFTGTPGFEANGVTVGYRAEYTQRTGTEAKYNAIEGRTSDVASDANHKGQYYIQLGEQLYDGKLKLSNDIDVFGRPSRKWEFDGKGIGIYAKTELLDKEYVGEVTGKDLFDLLGATTLKDYTTYAFVDGVWTDGTGAKTALGNAYFNAADMNKNNKAGVGATGTGTLTQVYVDHDKDLVYVVVINTYLAFANKDYDTKKEQVDIAAYSLKKDASISEYIKVAKDGSKKVTFELAIEDFPDADSIKKDDPLLITVADGEVQTFKHAEVLSAVTISAFSQKKSVTVDGTKYSYTTTAGYKAGDLGDYTTTQITNLKDRSYNVYLDVYGNLIGVEEVEAVKNYVFITGIDLNGSNRHNQTADASAIFLDGTMDSIKINMTKSEWKDDPDGDDDDAVLNTWCTYTKNGDVYTVKEVSDVGVTKVGVAGEVPGNVPSSANGKLAQFNQQCTTGEMTIDSKNYRMYGGGAKGTDYYNVYGDVDTVYLTAKLGELVKGNTTGTNYGIIDGVSSVNTGIANTDLTVWNNTKAAQQAADNKPANGTPGEYPKTSSGIYGLYNDKGLIIAAVVIGEDAGTAKDLVYVHTDGLEEEIDNGSSNTKATGDGLWTWTRKVVRNGEEVLLTEVGDYYDGDHSLSKMEQYKWYQVRTNASGNVIEAKEASVALTVYNPVHFVSGNSQYVTKYDEINDAIEKNGVKTVLYLTNGGPNDGATNGYTGAMEVKGDRTLAITNEEGSGIWFRDDVNVVLQYWNRNKQEKDIMTGEGVDDLKEMVDIVNDNNSSRGSATYFVSALIEDGRATTIVIYDSYNNYKRPGDTDKPEATGNVIVAKSFTGSKKPTMDGESKTTVNAFGIPVVSFNAKVPEWAVGTVNFTYNLYVNDTIAVVGEKTGALTIGAEQKVAVSNLALGGSITGGILKPSDKIRVEITDATYGSVKVKFVDNADTTKTVPVTEASTKTIKVGAIANATDLKVKVDETKTTYTSATIAGVDGVTVAAAGATVNTGSVKDTTEANVYTVNHTNVTVDGGGYVTVKLTLGTATPVPAKYAITAPASCGDVLESTGEALSTFGLPSTDANANSKLIVAAKAGTLDNRNEGELVALQVKLGAAAAADLTMHQLKVTVKVAGKTLTAVLSGNTPVDLTAATGSSNIVMTQDYEIESIKVERVEKLKVESVTKTGLGTYEIKFNMNVVGSETTSGSEGAFKTGDVTFVAAGTATGTKILSGTVKGDTVIIETSNAAGDKMVDMVETEGFKIVSVKSADDSTNVIEATAGLNTWKLNDTGAFVGSHT